MPKISSESQESGGRPSQEDLHARAEHLLERKASKFGFSNFQQTVAELEDLAAGNDSSNFREEYYSGWKKDDFVELLRLIAEGEERMEEGVSDKEIEDVAENIFLIKEKVGPKAFLATIKQIEEFKAGKGDTALHEEYYPGWRKEHFERLLQILKEERE